MLSRGEDYWRAFSLMVSRQRATGHVCEPPDQKDTYIKKDSVSQDK